MKRPRGSELFKLIKEGKRLVGIDNFYLHAYYLFEEEDIKNSLCPGCDNKLKYLDHRDYSGAERHTMVSLSNRVLIPIFDNYVINGGTLEFCDSCIKQVDTKSYTASSKLHYCEDCSDEFLVHNSAGFSQEQEDRLLCPSCTAKNIYMSTIVEENGYKGVISSEIKPNVSSLTLYIPCEFCSGTTMIHRNIPQWCNNRKYEIAKDIFSNKKVVLCKRCTIKAREEWGKNIEGFASIKMIERSNSLKMHIVMLYSDDNNKRQYVTYIVEDITGREFTEKQTSDNIFDAVLKTITDAKI